MPAGDVFGLDGFFLNKSNPVVVSTIGINSTGVGAGITVTAGSFSSGTVTLTLSTAAGLSTTPFYTGAKIAVSGLADATGVAHTGYNGVFVVTGYAGTTTVSYATTGYIGPVTAGITTTGQVTLVTDTAVTNTTWSSSQTHGWFGGGLTPGSPTTSYSTVDRIDFSNDSVTANIRGPLSSTNSYLAATGNSNYGWFGGGGTSSAVFSKVDRIDFSNDLGTTSVRGPLTESRYGLAATGNSNYGWFAAGGISESSKVDRIDFSNDSGTASLRGSLSLPRGYLAATGNSNYGWLGGGQTYYQFQPGPPTYNSVQRIDFSNDSTSTTVRGPLSAARGYKLAATGNSNYGWFAGGASPPTSPPAFAYSIVDRIDFANDTSSASVRGPLTSERGYLAATGNSNYGWFGGGGPTSTATAIVDRINFSNDSVTASPRGPLSLARSYSSATSGQARSSSTRLQKAGSYGWFGGGVVPATTVVATVDRIDFSNDLNTASSRGSLFTAKCQMAATGNSNYGWFGGGTLTAPSAQTGQATVDRIDFSNDSSTASVRGSLSSGRQGSGATGNSNYGWFGGSYPGTTKTVERIDFSNDSTIASPRSPLFAARYQLAATGNSNYGWFGGGWSPAVPGAVSAVDRIDFSNDSSTASVRGPLSSARNALAATGNSNYGWFGGGNPSIVRVDRINFANDSVSASLRGPLSSRGQLAATGNSNYGWFGGGYAPTPAFYSTVDRINFSNDSATASPRGSLNAPAGRSKLSATSNSTR